MALKGMSEEEYSKLSREELVQLLKEEREKASVLNPTFGIGEKGGVKVGGLGQRFPTTLYAESWLALLDKADELRAFIEENKSKLSWKNGEKK